MATTGEPFGLFWDSESGDRTYSAASFEYWLKKFFTSGVFNGDLQVKASSGMTLEIEPGYANVDGKVKFWNGAFTLTLNAANSTYPRIDTIVITRDNVNRQIVCEVVTGSYSGDTPQPTAPVRNSEIYQLVLAQIYVGAGVTGITQANITDTRPDNTLCGWITGTVEELDFSQFTAQFEQYFREFKADAEGDYESWFNEVQSEQIEDKEAWDAWYAALQEELHNLPVDSAEYLQIQIDELKESGLSGSIFKVTTINPSLEGKTVRIINADNTEEKTGTFDSNLECVIYGMKSVGEITITSTDGIETATSVISIPYFGNYTVPIAFWAATVNMQGDTNLYGATITIKDSDNLTVGTVVLSAVDGTGTFTASKADTYTFNFTYQGTSYIQELVVSEETTYSISLNAGFNWQIWVDTASQLDSTDYESLDEVLADEKALRELFLEHACVDYMASVEASNDDLETVINNDLCAKWINLSDYALDFLGANAVIKALMDEADKYGYGEWALMPQVPKMTSNTVPYGQAYRVSGTVQKEAWYAFNGNESDACEIGDSGDWEIGYKFINPICIKRVYLYTRNVTNYNTKTILVRASNDNSNWVTLAEIETTYNTKYYVDLDNNEEYLYYEIFNDNANYAGATEIQFYAWAPKGSIPIMTANNAPYGEAFGDAIYQSQYLWYAFDGNEESQTESNTTAVPWNIGYKSVNPICVKGFRIRHRTGGVSQLGYNTAFTLQGSNDGTNWDDLGSYTNDSAGNIQFLEVENNTNYYLYHRVHMTANASGGNGAKSIQFYGRELKVSVPTMTSNTAPYGEASSDKTNYGDSAPWKAFRGVSDANGNRAAWWEPSSSFPAALMYEFTSPMVIKSFKYENAFDGGSNYATAFSLFGSENGTEYEKIEDYTGASGANKKFFYAIENAQNKAYKKYKIVATSGVNFAPFANVNFYGLDYSEKEFEAGTTKKWLYDHGVELEELTLYAANNGVTEKRVDSIYLKSASGNYLAETYPTNAIDLTPYSVWRTKVDGFYKTLSVNVCNSAPLNYGESSKIIAGRDIYTNIGDGAFAIGLNISSISQSAYPVSSTSDGGYVELKEIWLE